MLTKDAITNCSDTNKELKKILKTLKENNLELVLIAQTSTYDTITVKDYVNSMGYTNLIDEIIEDWEPAETEPAFIQAQRIKKWKKDDYIIIAREDNKKYIQSCNGYNGNFCPKIISPDMFIKNKDLLFVKV